MKPRGCDELSAKSSAYRSFPQIIWRIHYQRPNVKKFERVWEQIYMCTLNRKPQAQPDSWQIDICRASVRVAISFLLQHIVSYHDESCHMNCIISYIMIQCRIVYVQFICGSGLYWRSSARGPWHLGGPWRYCMGSPTFLVGKAISHILFPNISILLMLMSLNRHQWINGGQKRYFSVKNKNSGTQQCSQTAHKFTQN